MARSEAQKEADARYEATRKAAPRITSRRLTVDEAALMDQLYGMFANKTEALLSAVKFYVKNHKK